MSKRKATNKRRDTRITSATDNVVPGDKEKEPNIAVNDQRDTRTTSASDSAVSGDKQKEQSTTEDDKERENTPVYQLATKWLKLVAAFINLVVPSIIGILLGFNPLPQSVPLLNIFRQHSFESLIFCGILLLATLSALIFSRRLELGVVGRLSRLQIAQSNRLWIGLTGVSSISFLLCLTLLGMVWFRPSWCPNTLCPLPQISTSSTGVHDSYLDLYPLPVPVQSSFYTLPGNLDQYSQNNLPENIGAVSSGTQPPSHFGIILGVHSLQQGRFGIVIEQVAIVIESVPPMPRPLNVWASSPGGIYVTNIYQVTYRGEEKNTVLPAEFVSQLYGGIELDPGEADQLNIQVSSHMIADLRFRTQVTYRVSNESQLHVLLLPHVFEVVFSDNSNWHVYRLENGRFLP